MGWPSSALRELAGQVRGRLRPSQLDRRVAVLGVTPGDVAIDCGANVGNVTAALATRGALVHVRKGGVVVCAGIHMSDIPSFPYERLWGERVVRSVANLTRVDGAEFLALAPRVPVRTEVEALPLGHANEALARLRAGQVRGALVLVP